MKIKGIFVLADFAENADFNLKLLMIVKKNPKNSRIRGHKINSNICENLCDLWEKKHSNSRNSSHQIPIIAKIEKPEGICHRSNVLLSFAHLKRKAFKTPFVPFAVK